MELDYCLFVVAIFIYIVSILRTKRQLQRRGGKNCVCLTSINAHIGLELHAKWPDFALVNVVVVVVYRQALGAARLRAVGGLYGGD